jgi:hypothetical protein
MRLPYYAAVTSIAVIGLGSDHHDLVHAATGDSFSSDPRVIRDITASFEFAWDLAIPHSEYKPG